MQVIFVQHVPFETPGRLPEVFSSLGAELSVIRLYEYVPEELPQGDILVIMGGPMNIYEEDLYPWLSWEKRLIAHYLENDKFVFGFCLGAQLIADVLGSRIFALPGREIGWFPVIKTNDRILKFLPDIATVFHWHGETFDLPEGALPLFRSDFTENQVFIYNNKVLALQFHLEMTAAGIEDITRYCADELDNSPFVMAPEKIQEGYELYGRNNFRILKNLISYIVHNNS